MLYEIIYLIGASNEAKIPEIKGEIEKIISEAEGVWQEKDWTQKRRLAYKIGKETQGTYIAKRFVLENKDILPEINQKISLLENILRFLISRADDLPDLAASTQIDQANSENREARPKAPAIEDKQPTIIPELKTTVIKEEAKIEVPQAEEEKKEEAPIEDKKENIPAPEKEEDIDKKLEEILNI